MNIYANFVGQGFKVLVENGAKMTKESLSFIIACIVKMYKNRELYGTTLKKFKNLKGEIATVTISDLSSKEYAVLSRALKKNGVSYFVLKGANGRSSINISANDKEIVNELRKGLGLEIHNVDLDNLENQIIPDSKEIDVRHLGIEESAEKIKEKADDTFEKLTGVKETPQTKPTDFIKSKNRQKNPRSKLDSENSLTVDKGLSDMTKSNPVSETKKLKVEPKTVKNRRGKVKNTILPEAEKKARELSKKYAQKAREKVSEAISRS